MKLRGAFNIFLVLVLLSVGVYFVSSVGSSFSTPSDNEYIKGNYTFSITYNSTFTNVTNVTLILAKNASFEVGVISYIYGNPVGNENLTSVFISNSSYPRSNGTSISFSINTNTNFSLLDGNYTVMAIINNNTGNSSVPTGIGATEYTNITFIVDNTPPSSLILIHPNISQTFTNYASIMFAFNVSDSMSGNGTYINSVNELMNCTLFVDGIAINRTLVPSNTSDLTPALAVTPTQNATYVFNVSSTTIDSGYHTWNITCWDKNNNKNETAQWKTDGLLYRNMKGGNFTLTDTQGPNTAATPTFSASSVAQDVAVTITCTGTDVITATPTTMVSLRGPNGEWQNGIGSSPYSFTGTSTVGTYYARCYSVDTAGNTGGNSGEATFEVTRTATTDSPTTTPGGGGTPTKEVNVLRGETKDLGSISGGQGVINAYESSVVNFAVTTSSAASDSHSITFDKVDTVKKEVIVIIQSDPIELTIKVEETKTVDIDGDDVDDLEVTLNSIDENGKANLNIEDLIGTTSETTGSTEEVTGGEGEIGGSAGMAWYWWVIIIVVIVIIIALIIPKKK